MTYKIISLPNDVDCNDGVPDVTDPRWSTVETGLNEQAAQERREYLISHGGVDGAPHYNPCKIKVVEE